MATTTRSLTEMTNEMAAKGVAAVAVAMGGQDSARRSTQGGGARELLMTAAAMMAVPPDPELPTAPKVTPLSTLLGSLGRASHRPVQLSPRQARPMKKRVRRARTRLSTSVGRRSRRQPSDAHPPPPPTPLRATAAVANATVAKTLLPTLWRRVPSWRQYRRVAGAAGIQAHVREDPSQRVNARNPESVEGEGQLRPEGSCQGKQRRFPSSRLQRQGYDAPVVAGNAINKAHTTAVVVVAAAVIVRVTRTVRAGFMTRYTNPCRCEWRRPRLRLSHQRRCLASDCRPDIGLRSRRQVPVPRPPYLFTQTSSMTRRPYRQCHQPLRWLFLRDRQLYL